MIDIKKFAKCVGYALCEKEYSVSPLKLQNILYYQDAWHIALFSKDDEQLKNLFSEAPEAWINGPVYPSIYYLYKNKTECITNYLNNYSFFEKDIEYSTCFNSLNLNNDEKDLYNNVLDLYGTKSQGALVVMTHAEEPWLEKRKNKQPLECSNEKISYQTMYHYYRNRYESNRKTV